MREASFYSMLNRQFVQTNVSILLILRSLGKLHRALQAFRRYTRPAKRSSRNNKSSKRKKRFDWTASKTKCVAFLHLCRRVPHIYAGIGYTWILTPAQKRVGFYWDLSSSHGRWIGKNSAFPVKGSLRRYCRYWINYFSSGGNKWVRPCQSHRKITVWIWRPAHLLDRLALGQSCVRPFSRLDIAIILNVYCCTVFDWVMQTVTLKHMTAVSLMFTFCATIIFFSTNISTATAFNCFSPRKCWRRAWWEIPTVYKPSQSVAKNL